MRGRGRLVRTLRVVLLLAVLLAIVVVGWTGWQALHAARELRATSSAATELKTAVSQGDALAARRALRQVQRSSAAADGRLQGPAWRLTERLPGVGEDIAAVRAAALLVDQASNQVAPRLLRAYEDVDTGALTPDDGRIDWRPLERAAPDLARSSRQLQQLSTRAERIDFDDVSLAIRQPVSGLQLSLRQLASGTETAARASALLPGMLGADGPRRYLLLVQNNAESRSLGGIVGAYALIRTDDGRIELGEQGSAGDLGGFSKPVLPLTATEENLYGEVLGEYAQNVTQSPSFPRAAELASAMWRRTHGSDVDGVLSVDPVALSRLLAVTGPVQVQGETVSADNAVPLLLNGVYLRYPDSPAKQDRFFAAAAKAVFERVVAGSGDPAALISALGQSVADQRVAAWSSRPDEQALLSEGQSPVSGVLPVSTGGRPVFGVYVNDNTPGKLDYYLRLHTTVQPLRCVRDPAGAQQDVRVTVRLESTAPDPATLPDYVAGKGLYVRRGSAFTTVNLYAPRGSSVGGVRLDGEPQTVRHGTDDGHPVRAWTLTSPPGGGQTISYVVRTGRGQTGDPILRETPMAVPVDPEMAPSACGASR